MFANLAFHNHLVEYKPDSQRHSPILRIKPTYSTVLASCKARSKRVVYVGRLACNAPIIQHIAHNFQIATLVMARLILPVS